MICYFAFIVHTSSSQNYRYILKITNNGRANHTIHRDWLGCFQHHLISHEDVKQLLKMIDHRYLAGCHHVGHIGHHRAIWAGLPRVGCWTRSTYHHSSQSRQRSMYLVSWQSQLISMSVMSKIITLVPQRQFGFDI